MAHVTTVIQSRVSQNQEKMIVTSYIFIAYGTNSQTAPANRDSLIPIRESKRAGISLYTMEIAK